jgi:hypothetical protein
MFGLRPPHRHWAAIDELVDVPNDEFDGRGIGAEASSSLASFLKTPVQERLVVRLVRGDSQQMRGMLCMALRPTVASNMPGSMSCTIHTLWVCEEERRNGVGSALLARAHTFAAAQAQARHEHISPAARPCLEWYLAPGSCRRKASSLLLFDRAGWRVVRDAERALLRSELLLWAASDKDVSAVDVDVLGPTVPLYMPVLAPGAPSGLHLFKSPCDLESPPEKKGRWERPLQVNMELLEGRRPLVANTGVYPLRLSGLLPFVAPLQACRELEFFLANSDNHSFTPESDGTITHKFFAGEGITLLGYQQYGTLNVPHMPNLQSICTLRTCFKKQECGSGARALLAYVPGLASILGQAASVLGLPNDAAALSKMLKHVHFLLLDGTSQVDFNWHEDTFDLSLSNDAEREKLLSVIVQLGDAFTTAMQIYSFRYHEYLGLGAGVIFNGRCVHRSISRFAVPANRAVWKVAAFILPPSHAKRKLVDDAR